MRLKKLNSACFLCRLQKTDKIIDKLEKHRDEVDAKAAQELQDGIKAEQRVSMKLGYQGRNTLLIDSFYFC